MVAVSGITKRYGSLTALDNISAQFSPGEIHAVLGENGAGKSTLVSIVSGFVTPDTGSITLDGKDLPLGEPIQTKRLGIEMIHQHFMLVPAMTVIENLALARMDQLGKLLSETTLADKSLSAAKRLGWELDPQARVGSLPVGTQQRIEILKALGGDASVLIFDEPTAVLSPEEVEDLFRVLRQLKSENKVVILIAHKLSEVMAIADRVTVLRKGKWIASAAKGEFTESTLAEWMVGELPTAISKQVSPSDAGGLTVAGLSVQGDRGEVAIREVSFEVRTGEILGIGGVDGNGQIELAEALAGIRNAVHGTVQWKGSDTLPTIGYIPQDRHADGLALRMSITENLLITGHRSKDLVTKGWLKSGAIHAWAARLIQEFSIKAERPGQTVGSLSGGNQQKVVVSRTMDMHPELLVVCSPTRGLDIRATQTVHETIYRARANGAAVILFSPDLDELAQLSDRVLFLNHGELSSEMTREAFLGA